MTTQIAIVGAGLSGSLAAVVLGRAGYRVTLIDRHPVYPKEFRVEKLAGEQIALLRRLGMLDVVAAAATPFSDILNVRAGRIIDRSRDQHYALRYEEIVRLAARRAAAFGRACLRPRHRPEDRPSGPADHAVGRTPRRFRSARAGDRHGRHAAAEVRRPAQTRRREAIDLVRIQPGAAARDTRSISRRSPVTAACRTGSTI